MSRLNSTTSGNGPLSAAPTVFANATKVTGSNTRNRKARMRVTLSGNLRFDISDLRSSDGRQVIKPVVIVSVSLREARERGQNSRRFPAKGAWFRFVRRAERGDD